MVTFGLLVLLMATTHDDNEQSIAAAVIYQPVHAADREAFQDLPKIALIAEKPQKPLQDLASQLRTAPAKIASAKQLYLFAAGPTLDGPDRVALHSLRKNDGKIILEIHHTSARLSGATLRRNITWHPLVQVPVQLPPGKWTISVDWVPCSDLTKGKPIGKPTKYTKVFEVQASTGRK